MEDNKIKEKIMTEMAAADFIKNTGLIMRTINYIPEFKNKWFRLSELEMALSSRTIEKEKLYEALSYLEGKRYIQARDRDSKHPIEFMDIDEELVDLKLTADGMLIVKCITKDPGIEM